MKSVVLTRASDDLARREAILRKRFLTPVSRATAWTPEIADHAAAYIGLLHSEAEHTLENAVRLMLANSRMKSSRHLPDQLLINCCLYYRDMLHTRLAPINIVPQSSELSSSARLVTTWDALGAAAYFEDMISKNHGAGLQYLERLLHPLGIVVTEKSFRKVSSSGVKPLATLSGSATMVTEFVLLRGSAMHAGTTQFRAAIRDLSPATIEVRGEGVVKFVRELTRTLVRTVW
jgi:hypothetical protein